MAQATKKMLKALEKVFAAEIEGRLPFQSKALLFLDLCDAGLTSIASRLRSNTIRSMRAATIRSLASSSGRRTI